jgi:hypothetical protein
MAPRGVVVGDGEAELSPGLTRSEVSWWISDHYPLWCEFLLA